MFTDSMKELRTHWRGYTIALLLATLALLVLAYSASSATPRLTRLHAQAVPVAYTVETRATLADLADIAAFAQSGEGVIRIVTRVCGSAPNWQQVAAANNIVASSSPPYLVLLGQRLMVSCAGHPAPAGSGATQPVGVSPPASATVTAPATATGWVNPVPGLCYPWDDNGFRTKARPSHNGVDLPGGNGDQPVRAAAAGTLRTGYEAGGAGNFAYIDHGGGISTAYFHLSGYAVRSGWVSAGQVIGWVGATGDAHGAHLHFQVHIGSQSNSKAVDPVPFMSARGVRLGC